MLAGRVAVHLGNTDGRNSNFKRVMRITTPTTNRLSLFGTGGNSGAGRRLHVIRVRFGRGL